MNKKERYEYLKSRKICVSCAKEKALENSVHCLSCKMNAREKNKRYREKYKERVKSKKVKIYKDRKGKGICVTCGRNKATKGIYCEECKLKIVKECKERKEYLIKRNLCTICGKEEIFKFNVCVSCRGKRKEIDKKNYIKNREKILQRNKTYRDKKRNERKIEGICIRCGKNKVDQGKLHCTKCLRKTKIYSLKKRKAVPVRNVWRINNCCWFCGEKELVEGKKVCKRCYSRCLEHIKRIRKARNFKRHIWRG
ncbi:hypothetical protein [Clostridium perfringens]|uniref:hypothetical protein n=1 Tax=Clostridium perfringens TaxID=1502 RepID=UPI00096AC466|nr:hypothetical protein [Clostridium perfringens]